MVKDAIASALLVSAAAAFAVVSTPSRPESGLAVAAASGRMDLRPDPNHRMILGVNVHRSRSAFDPALATKLQTSLGLPSSRDEVGQSLLKSSALLQRSIRLSTPLQRSGGSGDTPDVVTFTGGGSQQFAHGLPLTSADRTSFVGFLGAVGSQVASGGQLLELWNEWNLPTPLRAAGSVDSYGQLVRSAVPMIRKQAPNSKILIGAIGNDFQQTPLGPRFGGWTDAFLKTGLWKMGDGLSVHLYGNCMNGVDRQPIAFIARLADIQRKIRQANGGKSFPIYVTEVGWPERVGRCGFSGDERRDYSAQFLMLAQALDFVDGVWIYELTDSPGSPNDLEAHFGLANADYDLKSDSCGAREVAAILKAGHIRRASIDKGVVTILFDEHEPFQSAVWTADGSSKEMSLPEGSTWRPLCSADGWSSTSTIDLSSRPIFVRK